MASNQKTWTKQLSSTSLTITQDYGFTAVSILCTSGTITVLGTLTGVPVAPDAFTLSAGQGVNIGGGDGSTLIIESITINAASGVAAIIGK
jgi:hypothetical protein